MDAAAGPAVSVWTLALLELLLAPTASAMLTSALESTAVPPPSFPLLSRCRLCDARSRAVRRRQQGRQNNRARKSARRGHNSSEAGGLPEAPATGTSIMLRVQHGGRRASLPSPHHEPPVAVHGAVAALAAGCPQESHRHVSQHGLSIAGSYADNHPSTLRRALRRERDALLQLHAAPVRSSSLPPLVAAITILRILLRQVARRAAEELQSARHQPYLHCPSSPSCPCGDAAASVGPARRAPGPRSSGLWRAVPERAKPS